RGAPRPPPSPACRTPLGTPDPDAAPPAPGGGLPDSAAGPPDPGAGPPGRSTRSCCPARGVWLNAWSPRPLQEQVSVPGSVLSSVRGSRGSSVRGCVGG